MLRVVAAAIAVGALMVCAGPAVAEGLGDSVVTFANAPNGAATPADGLSESSATATNDRTDLFATSVEETDGDAATPVEETDGNAATSVEETDETVTPAASQYDTGATPAGLTLSLIRLGTRALALTVVPLHQFPAFDAVITHESGWDVFAMNPESGAYGLGQALPAEKMQTHGADWRFNPLTQIRWTYDYMNERYGSPDGAWAFWQQHHWY
ncbi:transglycosylase SLT domain-containing protein [Nocardia sp. CA-135398]|uniref:aggregation-promoting factor C-terminal-like domain-containing protein n=1 Tax=Nocardia sp. CA-135398 TaxID=3239977 RepID=UPI003D97AE14